MINIKKISANQAIGWKRDLIRNQTRKYERKIDEIHQQNKAKQWKTKRKYLIFTNGLNDFSLVNSIWTISSDLTKRNEESFHQLNESLKLVSGGNLL